MTAWQSGRAAIACAVAGTLLLGFGLLLRAQESGVQSAPDALTAAPATLAETGLYADFAARTVSADVMTYAPQYPLWSDGATKRRWIWLPPGSSIDASDPDHWVFPIGTKLWKEFAFGRRVETRFLTRGADGGWIYASYAWNADESEARLAPELGVIGAAKTHEGARFDIPSRTDCFACHRGGTSEVLGFGALQLSSERDPLAPHAETPPAGAVDLRELLARGLVRNLPQGLVEDPPHVVACTPRARAAIGYLHANCGGCHNATGPLASLGMRLDYSLAAPAHEDALPPAVATTLGCTSRFRACADRDSVRVTAGDVEQSLLYRRLASRNPLLQMPPLGTRLVDQQALSLVTDWIRQDLVASADSPDRNQPRSKE